MNMHIVLVDNPESGSAIPRKELREKCENANITIDEFVAIGDGFESQLVPFITAGKTIAAIGGDGTVSAVAGLVAGTKATLIPLPGGTLNHFTKDLDIPQDIDEALARLATLSPRAIDIAKVNDTPFINNSSIGLYPTSLRSREQLESALGKWSAAIVASWRAFVSFKTYRVTIDNETFATPFIFVGNNRYELDTAVGTNRTRLDEGVLTVYATKTQSRLTLLKIALFALIGRYKQLDEFEEFFPTAVTIKTGRAALSVSHDGEVSKLKSPLRYVIQPKALTILG
ncbi:diacylglycerol/lipid kinase family protein [Bifidobacterium tibiigranuli]|jgi:diacylglycerol kinase family enzyme|uniref:diacylglycerol/lipid kinase family protein n=1 Tax=Bifidobacterium tibiigranuli TaxID=2172043 RepID=UPI0026ED0E06|nr:diacylglycerol kinase family protein [Bifidobacterium tibiigranuli]MCI2185327.1 hypothetical protein [Bifidobacterium tibiigranuli]MCI2203698.1 hypothetical protein [Bifidobacterium tibiigranuli]